MSTDVDYYTKQRSISQLPQRRHQHLDCYDIITQDQHYSDLVNLAAKFRYNRLDRFKMFVLNGMLQRNQTLHSQIEKCFRRGTRLQTEERVLQPIKQGIRRTSLIDYPQLGRKTVERLKIQQEKNKKLMKAIHRNNENEISTLTTE
ncbi:unnamed protein product [Paramecium primaurelia]|uniref:Uncharacterized protein n=1 Tax=Paramecium primaurelia TaxID=5886 RepID=A0A8S1PKP4_PARPR|nr:unnamed protein product [Paramecium primaurelia]